MRGRQPWLWLAGLLQLCIGAYAACNSYATKCDTPLGAVFTSLGKPVLLQSHQSYYLSFTPPQSGAFVDVDLSVFYGSLQIFVAIGREPKISDFDYCTQNNGESDHLRIPFGGPEQRRSAVNVLLYADLGNTFFSGVFMAPGTPTTLISGIPLTVHMEKNTQAQFLAPIKTRNLSSLVLSSYAAVPPAMTVKLLGSNTQYQADRGVVRIVPQAVDVGKNMQATLTASNRSVLSIAYNDFMASDTTPILLQDGLGQHDVVDGLMSRYYTFSIPPGLTDQVLFTLDPLDGDADLFINTQSRGFYHRERGLSDPTPIWVSQHPSGPDVISIDYGDPNFPTTGGVFYISVYGWTDSEFVLTATLGNSFATLLENTPASGVLHRGHYRYYRFYDRNPTQTLYFDVLPSYGDADIMVACVARPTGNDNGIPSRAIGHFNFSSQSYWEDTLVIAPTNPAACSYNNPNGAIYYIAVYSFLDCAYTITAMHDGGVRILTAGIAVTGDVLPKMTSLYQIRSGFEAQSLTITLTPMFGDCDIYVKMKGTASSSNYDFKSINVGRATDIVYIPEARICTDCWITIAVYGVVSSSYSLIAVYSDDTVTLYNGVPFRGSVAQKAIQYYLYRPSVNARVVATLTILGGRDLQLHLSTVVEQPNATSWLTSHSMADAVVPFVALGNVPSNMDVHIGVTGMNSSYMIRVYEESLERESEPTLLALYEGVPQSDSMTYDETADWIYYSISMPIGHETLQVRITSIVGEVDMYLSKCTIGSPQQCAKNRLPTRTNYTLTTAGMESDVLSVYRNDELDTIYIIGVVSTSYFSAFQIIYNVDNSVTELTAGVAVRDHVNSGEYDYFSYFFDSDVGSLQVALTTTSGDPDVYISTQFMRPSLTNSTWRSQRFGSDSLEIDPSVNGGCYYCTYYIAVQGLTESTYTLLVTTHLSLTTLTDGVPQSGSVDMFHWNYYAFPNGFGLLRDLRVTLMSLSGNADLYITLDGSTPTLTNYAYSSRHWLSADDIIIHHSDPEYAPCVSSEGDVCVMKIGVYGVMTTDYSVVLASNMTATLLQLGVPSIGTVAADDYSQFKVLPGQQSTLAPYTLRLAAEPYTGHISLYVSCFPEVSTAATAMWSLSPAQSGVHLDISSLSFEDHGCLQTSPVFYVTVHGDTAASFSLTASIVSSSSVSRLIPNVAMSGSLANLELNYFYYSPPDSFEDLELLLTALQGDVDLYVSASWETRPVVQNGAVTSYVLKSDNLGGEDILIGHSKLQDMCVNRHDCYIVVAVCGAGAAGTRSTYSLLAAPQDSTITLSNGIPRYGEIKQRRVDYYVFHLLQDNVDVALSLTALTGDPDLFIGLGKIHHPSPTNFTWAHMNLGEDDVTLQYKDIVRYCTPQPSIGRSCPVYIGVYAWSNTTYSITASTDDGFLSAGLLLDAVPQSGTVGMGMYRYYRYMISAPNQASVNGIPLSIKFVMSPTDGGDVDLYIKFGNASLPFSSQEPGRDNYDYKSAGWSNVVEQVEITRDMPHFCYNCAVYVAVYGFSAGGYTLQATSSGVLSLQSNNAVGGHVDQDTMVYYSFYNPERFAVLNLVLTTLAGDGDLYVTTRSQSDPLELPTRSNYKWRSMIYGNDMLNIDYDDPQYCSDCDYIIGLYGFRNTTYTLLLTAATDSIIRLVSNRPQNSNLEAGARQYFSTVIASSLADVTVTLTTVTGVADLYVAVFNSTGYSPGAVVLPDPSNPRTYQYSTAGTQDDHVFIPGPHPVECTVVITVVAWAQQNVQFMVMATSTNRPVLLLSGVPQTHFVDRGQNELFVYYPEADDDLRVTVTARTGDPDLFISSTATPSCSAGSNPWDVRCGNYTYTSRMFSGDQIIISREAPCDPVLPSTYIDSNCDPLTAYNPSARQPIFIDVYGYAASKFILVAAPLSQTSQLLPGQPQSGYTSPTIVCAPRNEQTGVCEANAVKKKQQVSFFSFRVSPRNPSATYQTGDAAAFYNVMLTVVPQCNSSSGNASTALQTNAYSLRASGSGYGGALQEDCEPGCACSPLHVYVSSCLESQCTFSRRRPSSLPGQYQAEMTIQPDAGSTMFISKEAGLGGNTGVKGGSAAFCDPHNKQEDCIYYVAVSHEMDTSVPFSVTARTPGDVSLIPCAAGSLPDGIITRREDEIMRGNHHGLYYEVCAGSENDKSSSSSNAGSTSDESLLVEIEECAGSVAVYACADDNRCVSVLPTTRSYQYQADASHSCVRTSDSRERCTNNYDSRVHLNLPLRGGNYYLLVNTTSGSSSGSSKIVGARYSMKLQQTVRGRDVSPRVVLTGANDIAHANIVVGEVTGNTAKLSWTQSRVMLPGLEVPVSADFLKYTAYVFDTSVSVPTAFNERSTCGLEVASRALSTTQGLSIVPAPLAAADRNADVMSHTLRGLHANRHYKVVVAAVCDGACLRQVSKLVSSPRVLVSCNSGEECKTQSLVYSSAAFTTAATDDKTGDGDDDQTSQSGGGATLAIVTVLVVLLVIALGGAGYYYYKNTQDTHAGPTFSSPVGGIMELIGLGRSPAPYVPPAQHGGGSASTGSRWQSMVANFSESVRKTFSGSGGAHSPLPDSSQHSSLATGNADWSVPRPAWGGQVANPVHGRGQFTLEDDEELEVSL